MLLLLSNNKSLNLSSIKCFYKTQYKLRVFSKTGLQSVNGTDADVNPTSSHKPLVCRLCFPLAKLTMCSVYYCIYRELENASLCGSWNDIVLVIGLRRSHVY